MERPPATVALTFDDGPDPDWTPAVLDALGAAGARATFFVLGRRVRAHPGVVEACRAAGHAVELHGDAHLRHPRSTCAAVAADTDRALATLRATGVEPRQWRLPWGEAAPWSAELAAQRDLTLAGWTADTHDWRGDGAGAMLATVRNGLGPGSVVLMHDAIGPGAPRTDCEQTVGLIAPLVAHIRALGCEPA